MLVIGAMAGLLETWRGCYKIRICQLEQICYFYQRVRHEMETNRLPIPVLLVRLINETEEGALKKMEEQVLSFLNEKTYPSGVLAWREAYQKTEDWWYLNKEQKEFFLQGGQAFFGWNVEENVEHMMQCEQQMRKLLKLEKEEYTKKNRIWTPVGMLCGVLLVIIFI